MTGTIVWWSPAKGRGIISVTQQGIVQKYFLHGSRIQRSPEFITVGQFVKFEGSIPPPRPGLLPVAIGAEVSNLPFDTVIHQAVA